MPQRTPAEFQQYIWGRIPITSATGMGLSVRRYDDAAVTIRAPLGPNVNDKGTAFGGSIASLLTITAWATVVHLLGQFADTNQVVIQKYTVEYFYPIEEDFEATALVPESASVDRFLGMLRQFGKGRISIQSTISVRSQTAALFEGSFAALPFT